MGWKENAMSDLLVVYLAHHCCLQANCLASCSSTRPRHWPACPAALPALPGHLPTYLPTHDCMSSGACRPT